MSRPSIRRPWHHTIPRVSLTMARSRWWMFSWLQIWPDGDPWVWASKKADTEYIVKCESLKVAAVNTFHSETKQREMFFIHFHFSMMNVTGQWPSSWLFIWRSRDDGGKRMTVLMTPSILHLIKDETFSQTFSLSSFARRQWRRHDSHDSFLIPWLWLAPVWPWCHRAWCL